MTSGDEYFCRERFSNPRDAHPSALICSLVSHMLIVSGSLNTRQTSGSVMSRLSAKDKWDFDKQRLVTEETDHDGHALKQTTNIKSKRKFKLQLIHKQDCILQKCLHVTSKRLNPSGWTEWTCSAATGGHCCLQTLKELFQCIGRATCDFYDSLTSASFSPVLKDKKKRERVEGWWWWGGFFGIKSGVWLALKGCHGRKLMTSVPGGEEAGGRCKTASRFGFV